MKPQGKAVSRQEVQVHLPTGLCCAGLGTSTLTACPNTHHFLEEEQHMARPTAPTASHCSGECSTAPSTPYPKHCQLRKDVTAQHRYLGPGTLRPFPPPWHRRAGFTSCRMQSFAQARFEVEQTPQAPALAAQPGVSPGITPTPQPHAAAQMDFVEPHILRQWLKFPFPVSVRSETPGLITAAAILIPPRRQLYLHTWGSNPAMISVLQHKQGGWDCLAAGHLHC